MKLLKNTVFIKILFTDIIQQGAIWIRNIAIMFFLMDVTNGNPLAISTLNIVQFLPMFIFTFIGGIIADKLNPKKLMIFGDFLSFISFIILGLFIKDGYLSAIFIATLLSAIITQFSYPSSQKYFKEYVHEDDLEKAIGVSQLLGSLFCIVGPFIGSFFYFNLGIGKTLFVIAGLFLLSLCILITLPNKEFEVGEKTSLIHDVKSTFIYIKERAILLMLSKIFFILAFATGIANNLDIFLVTNRLGLDESYYQIFSGIAGIGVIVGGGLYIALSKRLNNPKILYGFMGIFAVTLFFEGYSKITILTMFLQFIDNVLGGILSGYVMTLITKMTDQEYLGKVNGLTSTMMYLGMMIGTVVSGMIVNSFSIVLAFSLASVSFILAMIIIRRELKH
ncbi:MAG: MFS transporter [Clostridium sp.]